MKKIFITSNFTAVILLTAFGNNIEIRNDITIDTKWSSSNTYTLKDFIFVTDGATLTIDPGTVIYADQANETSAPALVVTKGSKIHAEGTKDQPIIFTSVLDLKNNLTKEDKGLWGGLIILGQAPINSNKYKYEDNQPLTNKIDGIPEYSSLSGRSIPPDYLTFGGSDYGGDSGILKYVSIRHGGAKGTGWDLKGLSFAGVGSQTKVEHIEVFATKDDGIDFLGGMVQAKYLLVAYSGDDSFDIDEGYTGILQFLLSVQDENSNRAFEWDGSTEIDDLKADTSLLPDWSQPTIANVTAIGNGKDRNSSNSFGNWGLYFRDNAGGSILNSIFTEFSDSIVSVENTPEIVSYGTDYFTRGTFNPATGNSGSQALLELGVLELKGNLFYNGGLGNSPEGTTSGMIEAANIIFQTNNQNSYDINPKLVDFDGFNGYFNPFPRLDSPALSGAVSLPANSFLLQTQYRGAFADAGDNWLANWTKTDEFIVDASDADDDNDGLSNYEEINVYDTDPKKSDTDLDGINDKQEIEVGMNPLQSDRDMIDKISRALGMSDSSGPYTSDWFFLPNASGSWIYSTQELYPYFYDSKTKSWLFFKSNETGPRFYHYNARTWMNLNELAEKW